MSGSNETRASEAFEKRGSHDRPLTWVAASRMLPLVRRVVADVLDCQRRLAQMHPEKDRIDRHRHDLSWPERARRYHLDEDIAAGERALRGAFTELDALGVSLLDVETGRVGFPTKINKRPAFFTWLPGEETLGFWQYAADDERRPIPVGWTKEETRLKTKD